MSWPHVLTIEKTQCGQSRDDLAVDGVPFGGTYHGTDTRRCTRRYFQQPKLQPSYSRELERQSALIYPTIHSVHNTQIHSL